MVVSFQSRSAISIIVVSSRVNSSGECPSHSVPFKNVRIGCFDFLCKSSCTMEKMSTLWLVAPAIKMSVITSTVISCPQKYTFHGIKAIYNIKHQF